MPTPISTSPTNARRAERSVTLALAAALAAAWILPSAPAEAAGTGRVVAKPLVKALTAAAPRVPGTCPLRWPYIVLTCIA